MVGFVGSAASELLLGSEGMPRAWPAYPDDFLADQRFVSISAFVGTAAVLAMLAVLLPALAARRADG